MLQRLTEIVQQAGAIVRAARNVACSVREKTGPRDLVTKYDVLVQEYLHRELLALLPDAGFLGEEGTQVEDLLQKKWLFIVDPIDGTTNFVQGFHNSCVSVGLAHAGRMEYGVVYNPYDGELYAAQRITKIKWAADLPWGSNALLKNLSAFLMTLAIAVALYWLNRGFWAFVDLPFKKKKA